jgi:hypothetical protein
MKNNSGLVVTLCRPLYVLLTAILFIGSAHASTISFTLDDVFLDDGSQMTGSFNWTYTEGDFEGGSGEFSALDIPFRPSGTAPPLDEPGMVLTIESNQIEISLDGNFHDYGLDVSLKFLGSLSPTLPVSIDAANSSFDCCGNGFEKHDFIGGSISPAVAPVPIPAAAWLFGSALLGLLALKRGDSKI